MDLVFNGSRPETSFQSFSGFARKIFEKPGVVNMPWAKCLKGFLKDGQYDGQNLEGGVARAAGFQPSDLQR
ncbi:hypothetical protein N7468_009886 [Penicillium chermesinum]|uniref:Uncharacterized protein n=1 Tax=Penicillium chermesinum TaxID=63820 RepID=A0A9W9NDI7_9EURO|nr:uncharacterized protein N7468_009886 [Penicillium chermesinum]KAJ5216878.1 hypothetical protein N7468_009886 [Penicillium chermesinum]